MIPRSLPQLPPQISRVPPLAEDDSVNIDSSGVTANVSPKRSRPKRKTKTRNASRNSHLRRDNTPQANSKEGVQESCISNEKSLVVSEDRKYTKAQISENLSILDRLKSKRQNLADGEENFEMPGEHSVENNFSKNLEEKLPITVSSNFNGNLVSQPISKMFVEEERGFRAISNDIHEAVNQIHAAISESQPTRGVQSAVELAVKTEKFFHTFSTFCHGLLAGMALWQCIIVYQLGPPHFEIVDFFSHYSSLSQPIQTLFYFFFVICIVSAFDRYDVGNPQCSNSKCALACRSGLIIVTIYPISLLFSLGIAHLDDKLSLHHYNVSLWTNENAMDMEHDLFYWKTLNLGRCIGAVIGWIIVALQPTVNSFLHRLEHVGHTVK